MKTVLSSVACLLGSALTASAADPAEYLRDVKPILAARCFSCHGGGKQRGGLRLDTAAAILKGGDSGPAAVPGKSADSPLFQCLTPAGDTPRMPPKGPALDAAQVALVKSWIDAGAKAPAQEAAVAAPPQGRGDERDRRFRRPGRGREGREREDDRRRRERD
jgi:mono/diheme cytochrome c family protein